MRWKGIGLISVQKIRGNWARDKQRWAAAVLAYERHLIANPFDVAIWVQLGNCAKENGDFQKAMNAYMTARFVNEDDADVWLQTGHLFSRMKRWQQARNAYGQSVKLDPDRIDARFAHEHAVRDSAQEFAMALNILDHVHADTPAKLVALVRKVSLYKDPFEVYGEFVNGKIY